MAHLVPIPLQLSGCVAIQSLRSIEMQPSVLRFCHAPLMDAILFSIFWLPRVDSTTQHDYDELCYKGWRVMRVDK